MEFSQLVFLASNSNKKNTKDYTQYQDEIIYIPKYKERNVNQQQQSGQKKQEKKENKPLLEVFNQFCQKFLNQMIQQSTQIKKINKLGQIINFFQLQKGQEMMSQIKYFSVPKQKQFCNTNLNEQYDDCSGSELNENIKINQKQNNILKFSENVAKSNNLKTLDNHLNLSELDRNLEISHKIPCLFIKGDNYITKTTLVYFHCNNEEIIDSYELLCNLRNNLKVNILAMEYPGYGLYQNKEPSEKQVLEDSETVLDYLTKNLGFETKNIIVMGRSLGSGLATYVATKYNIGRLVLISPFSSLRELVKDILGIDFMQYFIKNIFDNQKLIKQIKCPALFIHGLKDKLIPYKHSQNLYNLCNKPAEIVLPRDMTHIKFDNYDNITQPLDNFLTNSGFQIDNSEVDSYISDPLNQLKF